MGRKKPSTSYSSFQQRSRRNSIMNITLLLAKGMGRWWLAAIPSFFFSNTEDIKYRAKNESLGESPTAEIGRLRRRVLTLLLMSFCINQIICTVAGGTNMTRLILITVCFIVIRLKIFIRLTINSWLPI